MKRICILLCCIVTMSLFASTEIIYWNFRDYDTIADGGVAANLNQVIEWTATGSVTYPQGPSGSGSASLSVTGWHEGANTKYWLIKLSTEGYENITVSSYQYSSGYGPRDFKLQYKHGPESGWEDIINADITVGTNWTSGRLNNLALPEDASGKQELQIRWIIKNNVAVGYLSVTSGGTSRIAEIVVKGDLNTTSIPDWYFY